MDAALNSMDPDRPPPFKPAKTENHWIYRGVCFEDMDDDSRDYFDVYFCRNTLEIRAQILHGDELKYEKVKYNATPLTAAVTTDK